MFDDTHLLFLGINGFTLLVSGIVGVLTGLVVGLGLRRPRTGAGLIWTSLVLSFLSLYLMDFWFMANQTNETTLTGVNFGLWLAFFGATLILAFLVRHIRKPAAPQIQN